MASNYQDEDIQAAWGDVFSRDKYRIMISCIADNYPQKKSVRVDYADINAVSVDFAMFLLDEPDTHLDREARTFLYDRLAAWARTCSVVIVSHDAAAAGALRPAATYVADGRRLSPAAARAL